MWTPKRVLLLSAGIAIFLAGYAVYAFFLGGIDGLPPLPQDLLPDLQGPRELGPPSESEIDRKLTAAFGADCPQLKKRIKFEDRKKGMVVAAADIKFDEPDGRVKLIDCSVALFKDHKDGKFPEINTIISDLAYLKFDIPIKDPSDMSKGKVIGAELISESVRGIKIINNHRTPETHDDLEVLIVQWPTSPPSNSPPRLFYDEPTGKIWTDDLVQLLDKKTQPHPTRITGHGMDLFLPRDQPGDKKQSTARAASKIKNDLSGVDRVVLKSTVEMHLYNSGFMAGATKPEATKPDPQNPTEAPTEASDVTIKTNGPFYYDLPKDVARFESPENAQFLDRVTVVRKLERGMDKSQPDVLYDQLECDLLVLQFRRRSESVAKERNQAPPPATAAGDQPGSDREIESAQATANGTAKVVLVLDSENLHCECQELNYQCATTDRGPRTVLKGAPVNAAKDSHLIVSRELTLVQPIAKKVGNKIEKVGQHMEAQGPGKVDLFDPKTKEFTTHAIFKKLLTQTKYTEGQRELDKLTLTEDAEFIEDESKEPDGKIKPGQTLEGQCLQVYLASSDAPKTAPIAEPKDGSSGAAPRQKPVKVEAFERVTADSADMHIKDCDHLTIRFEDVELAALPAAGTPGAPAASPPEGRGEPVPPVRAGQPGAVPGSAPPAPAEKDKDKDKPKQPIHLQARDVVVDVLRSGEKNDLKKVVAVGTVHVHQDGETPADKGVDIKGETLQLLHFVEGDNLKVFGDARGPAELQLGDLYLLGPKVSIDQKENTVAVQGAGAMQMPSNTNLDGTKQTKPGTLLVVHWKRDMLFYGRDAEFSGGVDAYQGDSNMQCELLQVTLDRSVSLKQGQKKDEPAKVQKVISHNQVCVLNKVKDKDQGDKVIRHERLNCYALTVDNPNNEANATSDCNASGPGSVTILQYGTADGLGDNGGPKKGAPTKQAKQAPPKDLVLMRTNIDFMDRMFSTQQNDKSRLSKFYRNIQVVYAPGDDLDSKVDPANLPKGAMIMTCDRLTVLSTDQPDLEARKLDPQSKKMVTMQTMQAEDKVNCWTNDMYARSEVAIFDQAQNTIIFRGSRSNPARVAQMVNGPGSEPRWSTGTEILYNKKDGTIQINQSGGISGELEPGQRLRPEPGLDVAWR